MDKGQSAARDADEVGSVHSSQALEIVLNIRIRIPSCWL